MTKQTIIVIDVDEGFLYYSKRLFGPFFKVYCYTDFIKGIDHTMMHVPEILLVGYDIIDRNVINYFKEYEDDITSLNLQCFIISDVEIEKTIRLNAYKFGVNGFLLKSTDPEELKNMMKSAGRCSSLYKAELDKKNKELLSMSLRLAENNILLKEVVTTLESFVSDADKAESNEMLLRNLKHNINSRASLTTFKHFEKLFFNTHSDFNKKLEEIHPGLTPSELKLCSLLRLNMSSKEIANLLHYSADSVKVSRGRLRKKLGLSNKTNLTAYLMKF